jgi:hypothetical protein
VIIPPENYKRWLANNVELLISLFQRFLLSRGRHATKSLAGLFKPVDRPQSGLFTRVEIGRTFIRSVR